jgi:tRNA threonylcarbamoyladenosine modification (KEOPS) complex  Pcc1 subunit
MEKYPPVEDTDTNSPVKAHCSSQRNSATAEIMITVPPVERNILHRSISIEARDIPSRRTRVQVLAVNEGLKLIIHADDMVSLRAALNSFLRFIDSSLRSIKIISDLEDSSSTR